MGGVVPKGPADWLAIAVGERGAEEGGTLRRGTVERFLLKNQVAPAVVRLFPAAQATATRQDLKNYIRYLFYQPYPPFRTTNPSYDYLLATYHLSRTFLSR